MSTSLWIGAVTVLVHNMENTTDKIKTTILIIRMLCRITTWSRVRFSRGIRLITFQFSAGEDLQIKRKSVLFMEKI